MIDQHYLIFGPPLIYCMQILLVANIYNDIEEKRDLNKIMTLKTDLKFQENDIRKFIKNTMFEMFSTRVRNGKAFAAEQKLEKLRGCC